MQHVNFFFKLTHCLYKIKNKNEIKVLLQKEQFLTENLNTHYKYLRITEQNHDIVYWCFVVSCVTHYILYLIVVQRLYWLSNCIKHFETKNYVKKSTLFLNIREKLPHDISENR